MLALLLLVVIVGVASAQAKERFVLLSGRSVHRVAGGGSWQPTKTDIDALNANLQQISLLKADQWPAVIYIEHPENYFRQYVAISPHGKKLIYVNAFCDEQLSPDWRTRLVLVDDGATCYWQAEYDPLTKKFSKLRMNARA